MAIFFPNGESDMVVTERYSERTGCNYNGYLKNHKSCKIAATGCTTKTGGKISITLVGCGSLYSDGCMFNVVGRFGQVVKVEAPAGV